MTWKKTLALILVLALFGAGFYYMRQIEQADRQNMNTLYKEAEPLQRQREALIAERDGLELDYALMMRDVGTVQLLFKELDEQVFTEVYPLMRDRGIVGVMGISSKEYPGMKKKLTMDQYNRLLKDGWGSCLVFEKNQVFSRWMTSMSTILNRNGISMPTAIFFPEGTYNESLNEELIANGFMTVILPADDGRSNTVTSLKGDLWFTGAMPWNYTGVNTDTELLARTNGANLSFTISFVNLWDAYEEEPFVRILDNWASMLDLDNPLEGLEQSSNTGNHGNSSGNSTQEKLLKPLLKSTNYESARAAHLAAEENNEKLEMELQLRKDELNARIQTLDEQIREIYDRWENAAGPVK